MHWTIGPRDAIPLDRPRLVGIVNVTPDSFSDGGRYFDAAAAIEHGRRLLHDGADVLDVGGESTRPGAVRVSVDEQLRRVLPVVEALAGAGAIVSVDTTRAAVARVALDAGARIVNDVSGGTEDPGMFALAAERACGLVLMHRLAPPGRDRYSTEYAAAPDYGGDVVGVVGGALVTLRDAAVAAGVDRSAIVVDPGLGFGKTVEQNVALMRAMPRFAEHGHVLSAASRKSFLGAIAGVEAPADRDPATVAVSLAHARAGVRLFRVHAVAMHRVALAVAVALEAPSLGG